MLVVQSVNRFARSLLSERRTSANPAKFRYRFSRSTVPGAVKRIEMEPVLNNILFLADSYKNTHHLQYPPGTTKIKSYFESRGGKFQQTVFFGLQYILKRWLCKRVTKENVDEAYEFYKEHFGNDKLFDRDGWMYIVEKHGGKLPLSIKAVPEGSRVPYKNVLFTVESTDEKVPWIANYFETILVQVWYPMTVCTNSHEQKRLIYDAFGRTSTPDKFADCHLKLHDFGYRGSTSVESAGIGGCAHLINFRGSDTISAILTARKYYNAEKTMPGVSIPASEHSTMTTWGRNGERQAIENMLSKFPDSSIFSIVCDSYNIWSCIDNIIGSDDIKDKIAKRAGTLVIRPDSGDPLETLMKVLDKLGKIFPPAKNSKGFNVFPQYLRVIQGDGVSYETINGILKRMEDAGWSAENVTFGSGGALLQRLDRDTQKCAYKACMAVINGEQVDVYKDPATDPGKTSKKGNVTLVTDADGKYKTVRMEDIAEGETEVLVEVFRNGELLVDQSLDEIRARIDKTLTN